MNQRSLIAGVIAFFTITFLSQCRTRYVTMQAMRPADITFPSYVKNLLLVDRTKFDKQVVNVLEGVLTGETPGQDRMGLQELMASMQQTIQNSPRFQMRQASEVLEGNSVTSAFPDPLDWTQVEQLCSTYNTEAVVSVEIFDTDFIVTNGKRKAKKTITTPEGDKKEIEVDEFYAQGIANIVIGIRLYNPKEKTIIDQQLYRRSSTWEATGKSLTEAAALLISKAEATRAIGRIAGEGYAYKISPLPVYLKREFYSKSRRAKQIPAGSRQADMNDWEGAIKTWESGIRRAPDKQAGRLCYNIAVAYEVLGDLPKAKEYATRAYVEFGNKKARDYGWILDQRMEEEKLLNIQMQE